MEALKLASRQFRKPRFALCRPRGPLTGAVQDESQLQEDASKLEAGSGGRSFETSF